MQVLTETFERVVAFLMILERLFLPCWKTCKINHNTIPRRRRDKRELHVVSNGILVAITLMKASLCIPNTQFGNREDATKNVYG